MPVTAWLPGNFQVLSITWCLYCVALSDATETEPTRKPVRVLCVWRLASIINPSPTFLVGISPVKRKSSGFNKFGLAYVNPCSQFEGELYINFQTAVLRTLPLVAAYHSEWGISFQELAKSPCWTSFAGIPFYEGVWWSHGLWSDSPETGSPVVNPAHSVQKI